MWCLRWWRLRLGLACVRLLEREEALRGRGELHVFRRRRAPAAARTDLLQRLAAGCPIPLLSCVWGPGKETTWDVPGKGLEMGGASKGDVQ